MTVSRRVLKYENVYTSFDGKEFSTAKECREYESSFLPMQGVHLYNDEYKEIMSVGNGTFTFALPRYIHIENKIGEHAFREMLIKYDCIGKLLFCREFRAGEFYMLYNTPYQNVYLSSEEIAKMYKGICDLHSLF